MTYERKELKSNCRRILRTARPRVWVVTLVFWLLAFALPAALSALIPEPASWYLVQTLSGGTPVADPDMEWLIGWALRVAGGTLALSAALGVLEALYRALMGYGYCGYALMAYRGKGAFGDLFSGFRVFAQTVGAAVLTWVFRLLWSLLILLVGGVLCFVVLALLDDSGVAVVLTCLVSLGMAVALVYVSYRYCLTPYYVVTQREEGAFEAVSAGWHAMKGNVGKRFVLDLSFLGWELLAAGLRLVTLLIGLLSIGLMNVGILKDLEVLIQIAPRMDPVAALQAAVELVTPVATQLMLVFGVALLIPLPLVLWLDGYKALAAAGFYETVAGAPRFAPEAAQEEGSALPPDLVEPLPTATEMSAPTPVSSGGFGIYGPPDEGGEE